MRPAEPLTPLLLLLLRFACRELPVRPLRHGGPCPAAVRPLVRPALAEALLRRPRGQSRSCPGGDSPPTSVLRRRQPEDAVGRPEADPLAGCVVPTVWRPAPPHPRNHQRPGHVCTQAVRQDQPREAADILPLHERYGFGQLGPGGDHHGHGGRVRLRDPRCRSGEVDDS